MIISDIILPVKDISDVGSTFTVKSVPLHYNVEFVEESASDTINRYTNNKVVVVDANVSKLYNIPIDPHTYCLTAIEENKNIDTVLKICDLLEDSKFKKKDTMVVIGGGITQDVSGMAAKLFKRGIKWVHIPTTLLAMCDSCIGGKAAVNSRKTKNQLALFTAPSKVVINTEFIKSLALSDVDCGLGEIVKLFAIGGQKYVDLLNTPLIYDVEFLNKAAKQALLIKKSVIEYDEFEIGARKSLNYGHTFGHAIEAITDYTIPHGIAIIYGMYIVNKLFRENEPLNTILAKFIDKEILHDLLTNRLDGIIDLTLKDKKNIDSKLMIVRVPENGICTFTEVEVNEDLLHRLGAIR